MPEYVRYLGEGRDAFARFRAARRDFQRVHHGESWHGECSGGCVDLHSTPTVAVNGRGGNAVMAMIPAHAPSSGGGHRSAARATAGLLTVVLTLWPSEARASFLPPELEDKLATFIALLVLFVVPVVLIVLFWMVHVLPEKIAHKRHHPQFEAIRTLCLLSLVFGGLLWPIAWLWAYSKPVLYKMAYGTDQVVHGEGESHSDEAVQAATLKDRIARLEERVPAADLQALRADVDALEAKFARHEVR
jgi:hypothetical protein